MKKFFWLLIALMFLFGTPAFAENPDTIQVLTFEIYDAGYPTGVHDYSSGTSVGGGTNAAYSGNSKYFTWTARGALSNSTDHKSIDAKDFMRNWEKAYFVVDISSTTTVQTSGNTFWVLCETCNQLDETDCVWYGESTAYNASGVSIYDLYPGTHTTVNATAATWAGTSKYAVDVTDIIQRALHYRFLFRSGGSPYPGSPAGTASSSEIGPKARLILHPKN